jgi:hypothetical protein
MSTIKDGGPAFPWNEKNSDGSHYHGNPGMSLRDWFAGQVLIGFLAGSWQDPIQADSREALEEDIKGIARSCYLVADAMLAVREEARAAIALVKEADNG